MRKPAALSAFKFFRRKFPSAGVAEANSILNLISSVNLLRGAYFASCRAGGDKPGAILAEIEAIAHPRASVASVLLDFFGVDRVKYPDFDPVELSDALGYDSKVHKLFGLR